MSQPPHPLDPPQSIYTFTLRVLLDKDALYKATAIYIEHKYDDHEDNDNNQHFHYISRNNYPHSLT